MLAPSVPCRPLVYYVEYFILPFSFSPYLIYMNHANHASMNRFQSLSFLATIIFVYNLFVVPDHGHRCGSPSGKDSESVEPSFVSLLIQKFSSYISLRSYAQSFSDSKKLIGKKRAEKAWAYDDDIISSISSIFILFHQIKLFYFYYFYFIYFKLLLIFFKVCSPYIAASLVLYLLSCLLWIQEAFRYLHPPNYHLINSIPMITHIHSYLIFLWRIITHNSRFTKVFRTKSFPPLALPPTFYYYHVHILIKKNNTCTRKDTMLRNYYSAVEFIIDKS